MTTENLLITILITVILLILLYHISTSRQAYKLLLKKVTRLAETCDKKLSNQFNQFEAYTYLKDRLGLHKGLPYTTHWSASPDFLKIIVEHCLNNKPGTILECSSGLTTLMLSRCCQMNSHGEVFSLENGEEYAENTRQQIQRYELDDYSTVIDAPLETVNIQNNEYSWYSLKHIPEKSIEMLVIDGPPGFIQKHSRYPALPLLFDKLAKGCVIFLDDAARDDEKELVKMWLDEHPEIEYRFVNTERGCSILTI